MKDRSGINRYVILTVGVLVNMCLGLLYSWSKFTMAIKTDLGFSQTQVTLAYTICMCMFTLGILTDGIISKRINSRLCAIISIILCFLGYILSSLISYETRNIIYLTYGVFVGLGIGMAYNMWLSNVTSWFPDKLGTAIGILLLGMGLSGLTTMPFAAILADKLGWRKAFVYIAVLFLIVGVISLLFLKKPSYIIRNNNDVSSIAELTKNEMIREPAFWTFALWKLVLISLGQAIIGQVSPIVSDAGGSDNIQLMAISAFALFNGLARLLWGFCCDKAGLTRTMVFVTSVGMLSQLILSSSLHKRDITWTILALVLTALCYGGTTSLNGTYISTVFGIKNYRSNNGYSSLVSLPSNLGATYIIAVVKSNTGSYIPFTVAMIPAILLALYMCYLSGKGLMKIKKLRKKADEI
ncbi:MAG: MFS transporter [Ruminiclostridium sp.]|nr:MFS transporter [Ruminiclostridium sp.]